MTSTILFILLISFVASLVRSTFGFGESLVAIPLFFLFMPVEVAVPVSILLSIVIALIIMIQDHKQVHFKSAKWMILYAILGLPIGIALLIYGSDFIIKIGIGLLLIFYTLYSLFKSNNHKLEKNNPWHLFIAGFSSGILGGAYGLNGPPLVIYGHLKNWDARKFRATLQAYFLPISTITIMGYYSKGMMTEIVYEYFLIALITTIPAVFSGRYFNQKLKSNAFYKYVYWALFGVGIVLISSTLAMS